MLVKIVEKHVAPLIVNPSLENGGGNLSSGLLTELSVRSLVFNSCVDEHQNSDRPTCSSTSLGDTVIVVRNPGVSIRFATQPSQRKD